MIRGHVPLRTCVTCNTSADRRDLVRLVRTRYGSVEVDETNRMPGRGAYLCRRQICWGSALKKNRLEHKLRGRLSTEDWVTLKNFAQHVT